MSVHAADYAIAEKSTLTTGGKLPVNAEKFKGVFGEDWSAVVAEGRALNALEFKNKFAKYQAPGALDKARAARTTAARSDELQVKGVVYK